jgi:tRNA A-37 threonylcarbamoyl transferase component Bud32
VGPERDARLRELRLVEAEYLRELGEGPTADKYPQGAPKGTCGETVSFTAQGGPANPPLVPGYEVLGELGRGGMGVVYKARQLAPDRLVALKVIRTDRLVALPNAERKQWLDRFRREAQLVASLDQPAHIVTLYEVGELQGQPYFTMRLVEGGNLGDRLRQFGALPAQEAAERRLRDQQANARLLAKVARAVDYAHQRGVLHRDLKPGNILLDARGEPLVTDFGLARRLDQTGSLVVSAIEGSPPYMAPEQVGASAGAAVIASDVYSLGAILYEALTGRPPFQGKDLFDILLQVLHDEPVPPRNHQGEVSRDLETICLKCLSKEPARRYRTAADLADDLERFLAGEPIQARPVGRVERGVKWVRRNPVVSALLAAVFLVLIGGIVVSSYFAVTALEEARAARKAKRLADRETVRADAKAKEAEKNLGVALVREKEAKKARADAGREAEAAKAQARRAEDARHAIQIDLALRAREQGDYDRMGVLLTEMRPEYQSVWETCHVRNLWLRHAFPIRSFIGHTGEGVIVAFSPDGKRVLTGSWDSTARVWDAQTGQQMALLKGHTGRVRSVAFSPDGKRVLTGSHDRTARLWDAQTGQEKAILKGHTDRVVSVVAYSPDGKRVLTGSEDRTARLWDASTGQEKAILNGHTGWVVRVAFSPDGKRALTGSWDRTARLWDAETVRPALPAKKAGR